MEKQKYECENCGAALRIAEGGGRAVCPYCGKVYELRRENGAQKEGLGGVLSRLYARAEIVAANYGLAAERVGADSFAGDGREEERRLLAAAEIKGGVLVRFAAREPGEAVRVPNEVGEVAARAAYKDARVGCVSFAPEVKKIGKKAFSRCPALSCVRLEGVETLGARAFAKCPALREVTIARHIPYVGRKVFVKCGGIARVILPRSMRPQIARLFGRLAKFRIEFIYAD